VTYIFEFFDIPQLDNYFSFYIFLYIIEKIALPVKKTAQKFTWNFQDNFFMFLLQNTFLLTQHKLKFLLYTKAANRYIFSLFLTQSSLDRCAPITAIFNQVSAS